MPASGGGATGILPIPAKISISVAGCVWFVQGQDHHLALFVLLPSREIADRPQLALLVHREQVHVQD
jgi:hypothetical protein